MKHTNTHTHFLLIQITRCKKWWMKFKIPKNMKMKNKIISYPNGIASISFGHDAPFTVIDVCIPLKYSCQTNIHNGLPAWIPMNGTELQSNVLPFLVFMLDFDAFATIFFCVRLTHIAICIDGLVYPCAQFISSPLTMPIKSDEKTAWNQLHWRSKLVLCRKLIKLNATRFWLSTYAHTQPSYSTRPPSNSNELRMMRAK